MIVLFLSGWSGAGKDAVASILQTKYGFRRLAFADPLKVIVADELGLPLEVLHTQEGKARYLPNGETVRDVLIRRGQEIRAEVKDPGYFANCIANWIDLDDGLCNGYVISDWRLMIEFQTLTRRLGPRYTVLTARIYRRGQTQSPVSNSYTENGLDTVLFDVTIENPGITMSELETEIVEKLKPYLKSE